MNRKDRTEIAEDTLEIIDKGKYINSKGKEIILDEDIKNAVENSILYTPQEIDEIKMEIKNILEKSKRNNTIIDVNNETTLEAAEKLKKEEGYKEVVCLNFASGTHPGGGFLNGSGAQEESLARSSALYPCIKQMEEMYKANKRYESALYKDYMIYSPNVPVFKKDNGQLLDEPYKVSFITAPAVNAGAVKAYESKENIDKIPEIMKERIKKIISLAVNHQNQVLVLGAFGCGVFRNDPQMVAEYFSDYLLKNKYFKGYFEKVIFAVLDRSRDKKIYNIFENIL
jgi:uncharacterized protein (TIGR02452 family)